MYHIIPELVQDHINDLQGEAHQIQLARLASGKTHRRFRRWGLINLLSYWRGKLKIQRVASSLPRLTAHGIQRQTQEFSIR